MKQRLLYYFRWAMWNILSRMFVRFWLKPKYNFSRSLHSDPLPRPPFVVVANHGTFFDPWIIGYFSRYPFAIMCNDDAFRGGAVTRWYLRSIGAFPKKKGARDRAAMKKTMSLLASGYPVCIFPEGQTSWDGETQLIYKGIEKIVLRSGVPLVMVRISGNFLTRPWWAGHIRKGRIECLFKTLRQDQIRSISENDLFLAIKTFISHSDIKTHASGASFFSGPRLAEGLERFVWMCMHCESEDTLLMSGDVIRCKACGSSWTINALCRLAPLKAGIKSLPDLQDWAQWHRIQVRARVASAASGDVLTTNAAVRLQSSEGGTEFTDRGDGALILTKESLTFSFTHNNAPLDLPVAGIADCVIQRKDIVEIRHGTAYYRFAFKGHSPMKWVYYLRYLQGYEKYERQGFIG